MTEKKLRILHAAVSMNPSIGVVRQMEWEQQAAKDLNLNWDVSLHTLKKVKSDIVINYDNISSLQIIQYFMLRYKFYSWLRSVEKNYDFILLRHSVHDVFEADLARKFGNKLLTVHHTLEIPELAGGGGFANYIKAILEKLIGSYSLRQCVGCVSVTNEILEFERNRVLSNIKKYEFVYPNGINFLDKSLLDKRGNSIPEILFVASCFVDWHGLDLLLDAAEKNSTECIFHLVGEVPSKLKNRCEKDSRFILHGLLTAMEIKDLMERSWCGLSSFALFRKDMKEACTLKVREYLEGGLPVYAAHRDIFPEEFIFYNIGEVNVKSIVFYAISMRNHGKCEIRDLARPYIDKTILLNELASKISSCKDI